MKTSFKQPDVIVRRKKQEPKAADPFDRKPPAADPFGRKPPAPPVPASTGLREKEQPAPAPAGRKLPDEYYDKEAMSLSDGGAAAPEKPRELYYPPRREYKPVDGIDPCALFMSYHLGITPDNQFRPQNIHDLARRFRSSPDRINEALKAYELDAETVMCTDFDLAMAQIDIRVAPEGVSKLELGRQLYEDFRAAPRFKRDWHEELRRDAADNQRIFNKLK